MKKNKFIGKVYLVFLFSAVLLAAAGLSFYTTETMSAAKASIKLCLDIVIPSLFPFLVVSSLFVNLGLASYAGKALEGFMQSFFGLSGTCAPAFVLGLIGGYPVGVKTAVSIYQNKLCTKEEAERLLAFCNNSGPAFILGVVGAGVFKSASVGILLYLTHVLSSVTVGVLIRFLYKRNHVHAVRSKADFTIARFSTVLIDSIKNGFSSVLNISSFVIFFAVFVKLLTLFHIFTASSSLLAIVLNPIGLTVSDCERILTGFIELTSGLWSLTASSQTIAVRLAMAAFILGFAGISVHCQAFSFMSDTDLSKKPYLIGKLLHGIIAAFYTFLSASFLKITVPTFSAGAHPSFYFSISAKDMLLFSFCSSFILCFLLLSPAFLKLAKKRFQKLFY